MKNKISIWQKNEVQVMVICLSLYFLSALLIDIKSNPHLSQNLAVDSVYSYLIRMISLGSLLFGLINFYVYTPDYVWHLKAILLNENHWIKISAWVALMAIFTRFAFDVLFPSSLATGGIYMTCWIVLTASIVLPLIVVASIYQGKYA